MPLTLEASFEIQVVSTSLGRQNSTKCVDYMSRLTIFCHVQLHVMSRLGNIMLRQPHILSRQPHIMSCQPNIMSRQPHIMSCQPIFCHVSPYCVTFSPILCHVSQSLCHVSPIFFCHMELIYLITYSAPKLQIIAPEQRPNIILCLISIHTLNSVIFGLLRRCWVRRLRRTHTNCHCWELNP